MKKFSESFPGIEAEQEKFAGFDGQKIYTTTVMSLQNISKESLIGKRRTADNAKTMKLEDTFRRIPMGDFVYPVIPEISESESGEAVIVMSWYGDETILKPYDVVAKSVAGIMEFLDEAGMYTPGVVKIANFNSFPLGVDDPQTEEFYLSSYAKKVEGSLLELIAESSK